MPDLELHELRAQVDCRAVLEKAGWTLDGPESTKNAAKYRGGQARIVIVTHNGRGWFDPLNDAKGDVIALAQYLWGGNLGHARKALRPLAGIAPSVGVALPGGAASPIDMALSWSRANRVTPSSEGHAYLTDRRGLPASTVAKIVGCDGIREGIRGTIWGAHRTDAGEPCGWEMRGPSYKGFSKGGRKTAFWIGEISSAPRVVITESMIDALSLVTMEGWPGGSVYVSTGGGFGPETGRLLGKLLPATSRVVAATDRGRGGDLLARRIGQLSAEIGASFSRLRPEAKDWNAQLVGAQVRDSCTVQA